MTIAEKTKQLPDLLKVSEVASLLRISQPTVKRWVREGWLKGHQFGHGGAYRIEKEEILKKMDK
jgi:excisionase family DNA binding protein|tara:strand:- start:1054 stop:1245 length:192 start_codon:yes stop_codon:yes gene_type:complete